MRAVDIVRRVAPRGRPEYLDAFDAGDALLIKAGITTPGRLAHFLAQIMHESGALTIEFENMNYHAPRIVEIFGEGHHSARITASEAQFLAGKPSALAERVYGLGNPGKAKELGNTQPGDGYRYRGGGILQTTGRGNYTRMGEKCDVDFESSPELVCSAAHSLKPALAEWTEGNLNALADADNLRAITKKINGGYNGLTERQAWFAKIRPLADDYSLNPVKTAPKPKPKPIPPPPDIEPPKPAEPKSPMASKTIWAKIGTIITAIGGFFMAADWRVQLALIVIIALAGLVIYWRLSKDDIAKAPWLAKLLGSG